MVSVLRTVLVLAVVLSVAGCASFSSDVSLTPSARGASVSITNADDARYAVSVTAIPAAVDGLELTYANGSTRTFDVPSFDALPRAALRNATAIATTDGRAVSEHVTVGPGEGIGLTLESAPENATVVYFVSAADGTRTARGAGTTRCGSDAATTELTIEIRADGSIHATVSCHGE